MNDGFVSTYVWHEVDGTQHAFSRFRNRVATPVWTSVCARRFSAYEVKVSVPRIERGRIAPTRRCHACISLVEANSS